MINLEIIFEKKDNVPHIELTITEEHLKMILLKEGLIGKRQAVEFSIKQLWGYVSGEVGS